MDYSKSLLDVKVSGNINDNYIVLDNIIVITSDNVVSIQDVDYVVIKYDGDKVYLNKPLKSNIKDEDIYLYDIPNYIKNMLHGDDLKLLYVDDVSEPDNIKNGFTSPGWWKYKEYKTLDGENKLKCELIYPINLFRPKTINDSENNEIVKKSVKSLKNLKRVKSD